MAGGPKPREFTACPWQSTSGCTDAPWLLGEPLSNVASPTLHGERAPTQTVDQDVRRKQVLGHEHRYAPCKPRSYRRQAFDMYLLLHAIRNALRSPCILSPSQMRRFLILCRRHPLCSICDMVRGSPHAMRSPACYACFNSCRTPRRMFVPHALISVLPLCAENGRLSMGNRPLSAASLDAAGL